MPLQENTLWNTGVLDFRFNNVESIIFKIVIEDTLSDSKVFVGIFDNRFLEVNVELENLSVILEPFRCNGRDTIIHLLLTRRDSSKTVGVSFSHGFQELRVNILLKIDCFLSDCAILNAKKLSLVVSGDSRISVSVSGEEW